MAETDLCLRLPESSSQTSLIRPNRFSRIHASLLKKQHNYEMLCDEIEELPQVLSWLRQNEVITIEELNEVNSLERRRRRVAKVLDILFTRTTEQWVEQFLESLEVTDQSHVITRLKRRTPPTSTTTILTLRRTDYKQRVMLLEEDAEDSIRRKYSLERVRATKDILGSGILSIYKGSIVFILDPSSEKAITELWQRNTGSQKIGRFLCLILNDYELKERFTRKRIVRVELTEEPNEFHCRIRKSSNMSHDYVLYTSPKDCSDCFRRTVFECYENILDEIETKMIQKTFHGKDSIVPEFIKKACIYEKEKRSRKERADIFLQCILRHEQLLMDFKNIFHETSKFCMPQVPCESHGGSSVGTLQFREKIVLHFVIYFDRSENTMRVNSVSSVIDHLMRFATEDQLSSEKVQQLMLKFAETDIGDISEMGDSLASPWNETDMMKSSILNCVNGKFISKIFANNFKMDLSRLKAITEMRNRLVHSPLSVSAEDFSVYQENCRLALVELGPDSNCCVEDSFRKWCLKTRDHLTNVLVEPVFDNDAQSNWDDLLCYLLDRRQSVYLEEDMNGEFDETRIVLMGDSCWKNIIASQLLNCFTNWDGSDKEPKRETFNDLHFRKKIVVTSAPNVRVELGKQEDVIKQIGKAMVMTAPGPHALMLVVKKSKVDVLQLNEMIQSIIHFFGVPILQHTIVSVIGDVRSDRICMKKLNSYPNIQEIVKKGRVVYLKDGKLNFSNRNKFVENVLQIIEQTAKSTGQAHFTSITYEKAEELVMRKTLDLYKTNQEEYRRHEIATAFLKAKMTPHQIVKKRIKNSNPREDVIQNVDKVIDVDFLRCLYMTIA